MSGTTSLRCTPRIAGTRLSAAPGAAHRRRDILESVWDAHWYGPTKTLDVHMAALRRKLGHGEWIETVRGVGYRFVPPA